MAFGIDEVRAFDEARVESFLDECHVAMDCMQIVATTEQSDRLIRLDGDSSMMQHRGQPVQVMCFDGDSLVFYHVQCYTQSGFLRFDWNNYGSFATFPPSPSVVADPHGTLTLGNLQGIFPDLASSTRFTVVILWCDVLRRVSRKAVETVAANVGSRPDVTVWLVNTDHWWVDYMNRPAPEESSLK